MWRDAIKTCAGAVLCLGVASGALAQQTSSTMQTKKFEIVAVEGNMLVVRGPDGTKELTVPDDFRFTVDGKPLSVRELKPGMKGEATITTTTTVTPVYVTEIREGTVMQVSGSSVIIRGPNGIKMYSQGDVDKRGIKLYKHGEPVPPADLHTNDKLSATIVTEMPPKVVTEREVNATLAHPAKPGEPAAMASSAPAASTGMAPAATPNAPSAEDRQPVAAGRADRTAVAGGRRLASPAARATAVGRGFSPARLPERATFRMPRLSTNPADFVDGLGIWANPPISSRARWTS